MNLLTEPIISISDEERMSLPSLLAAMACGKVSRFSSLRAHQRPSWHMFTVQLAVLALWSSDRRDLPREATAWIDLLRGLTPDHADDAPWRMLVESPAKPAFLQPPDPGKLKWTEISTPDDLDLLITARNHDIKQLASRAPEVEDWLFALVSLQTSAGYDGRGNYGIARMYNGSASRPMMGLAPARKGNYRIDPSAWWARDVNQLLAQRLSGDESQLIGSLGGPALLWCVDWPDGQQLHLSAIDPLFIEVSRRVRLRGTNGKLTAVRSTSRRPRIDGKMYHGIVGDPWMPVHRTEGKSLWLRGGDFDYKRLSDLLFGGSWEVPTLAKLGSTERAGDHLLIAEALSRGNCKTEGFKTRIIPVPDSAVRFFQSPTVADYSRDQVREIKAFDEALRNAISLVAAGGDQEQKKKRHNAVARSTRKQFDRAADSLFFFHLWNRLEAQNSDSPEAVEQATGEFRRLLLNAAQAELEAALPGIPCPSAQRPRAEARSWRAFFARVNKLDPQLRSTHQNGGEMLPRTKHIYSTAVAAAGMLQHLGPGRLAELRRMNASSAGAPTFWRLAAQYHEIDQDQETWMAIIKIVAILTPKGDAAMRQPLHVSKRRLGAVLCDGGNPVWPNGESPRPALSERRLAQLMAARGTQRAVYMERAARAIRRTMQPGTGVNVSDLAQLLLDYPDRVQVTRQLAESYYKLLDRADRKFQSKQEKTNE